MCNRSQALSPSIGRCPSSAIHATNLTRAFPLAAAIRPIAEASSSGGTSVSSYLNGHEMHLPSFLVPSSGAPAHHRPFAPPRANSHERPTPIGACSLITHTRRRWPHPICTAICGARRLVPAIPPIPRLAGRSSSTLAGASTGSMCARERVEMGRPGTRATCFPGSGVSCGRRARINDDQEQAQTIPPRASPHAPPQLLCPASPSVRLRPTPRLHRVQQRARSRCAPRAGNHQLAPGCLVLMLRRHSSPRVRLCTHPFRCLSRPDPASAR